MADVRDGWTCEACGASAPDDADWCPECGADRPEPMRATPPSAPVPPSGEDPHRANPRRGLLLVLPNHVTVPLEEGEPVQLGRETEVEAVDAALEHFRDVSRHHAIIELRDGAIRLTRDRAPEDAVIAIGSTRVVSTGVVEAGDRIRLGSHCWFRVVEA